jgi:photosystem II stability/assembly factor-like uncharacterized protein
MTVSVRFAAIAALSATVGLLAQSAWQVQPTGSTERLRGVSAVSDRVAWASGNKGTVVRTADGGRTWSALPVPGAESLDFRDIEAIDERSAYVLAIGGGDKSRIYKTTDAGSHWTLQFTNPDPKAFYDAIAFWDERSGIAVGDPVDGRFAVLRTTDGGTTWTPIPEANRPTSLPGDGMFAASGTCLAALAPGHAWFGTGGAARARVLRSTDRGLTWSEADTPIAAGTSSAGIFSVAFNDGQHGLIVGGDYRKEQESSDNLAATNDGGKTWAPIGSTRLRGFRSGVVFVPGSSGRRVVAVGPSGSDISVDGGKTWSPLADSGRLRPGSGDPAVASAEAGFHAISVDRAGSTLWAAGERGKVGRFSTAAR